MAFDMRDLSVLAYVNGFTLWHYRTADTAGSVADAGYFLPAADVLRRGDMIMANMAGGSGGLFCIRNTGAAIEVAAMMGTGDRH